MSVSAPRLRMLASLPRSWSRLALLGLAAVGAVLALILFAYELALARIPQHRAALERIVRAQTGLDIRFTELGLRWGWYGPEAVFRQVELDQPDSAEALLRAPELVVGFDAWRTLRSGHPEAGRIELVAPEIDLSNAHGRRRVGAAGAAVAAGAGVPGAAEVKGAAAAAGGVGVAGAAAQGESSVTAGEASVLGRVAVLQGWRGGRIDIEGGTLRLPDHGSNSNLLNVQIRRASLRRSDEEWSLTGLMYLPDRVGRTARVTLKLSGDLAEPATLGGSLHVEAKRLLFPGCRDFLAGLPDLARYLPRAGNGDVSFDVSFTRGEAVQVSGYAHAGGLLFDSLPGARNPLALARLRGGWRANRLAAGWRLHLKSLDLSGFDLAGMQLEGTAHGADIDWFPDRPAGERLQVRAKLDELTLVARSKDFTLSGLTAQLSGNETQLSLEVQSHSARLELAQSQQEPLTDVHVASTLRVSNNPGGWQIATDRFLLEHQRATLRLSGMIQDDPLEPRIEASGTLTGADVPLVSRLLGAGSAQAFGAIASRLSAGRIQNAEFALRGPIDALFSGPGGEGFSGSLSLRDAVVSGGDLWPDANGVEARVEWHGARIQATIESGQAGPFQLATAKAQWDATGDGVTRLVGHVAARVEDAIAWIRDHPQLEEYAPQVADLEARGQAGFDLNVLIPAGVDSGPQPAAVVARVSTSLDGATVQPISGLPALQGVTGSFTFDSGHLQKSTLAGTWFGGPVTLRVGEGREKGSRVLSVQAQGTANARQLAAVANATGTVEGNTDWNGELAYVQGESSHWRMRLDSSLSGLASSLPQPFAKRPAVLLPAHLEVTGSGAEALLHASLGDRMRSVLALRRKPDLGWVVDRGAVRLGAAVAATLPSEPVVLVRGRLSQLDLPAYALALERLRYEALPGIRAQLTTDSMLVAGRSYGEASLRMERTARGTDLLIDSAQLAGIARWPGYHDVNSARAATNGRGLTTGTQPAELRLTRLDLPDETIPTEAAGLIAALAPSAVVSVDELTWRHRSLGRLTANANIEGDVVAVDDWRLVNGTEDARGMLRCQSDLPVCRLTFSMDSTDAQATLADFGFRPDISAQAASLKGDLEWRPAPQDQWLASLSGSLSMRLAAGTLQGSEQESDDGGARPGQRFGLLAVPALVAGLDAREPRNLHFDRLEADFELQNGQASTSNLHFDGDAEILMRGRTGLASRDYDQQVWVLRGEERLPAAVRRFGATPRVAAAWLSLRDLFSGGGSQEHSRALLRLQGSWDDPMVVAEN